MEFASIYRSFGCEVTVVEFLKECLPALDSDIAKRLRKQLEQRGVQFALQSGVTKIEQLEGNVLRVHYQKKGKDAFADAELVLMATGRAANVGSLGLENTEIAYTKAGITVDENMQTNVPGVYAIGDVNGKQMLAHAATFQGFRAVNHIVGHADRIFVQHCACCHLYASRSGQRGIERRPMQGAGHCLQMPQGILSF